MLSLKLKKLVCHLVLAAPGLRTEFRFDDNKLSFSQIIDIIVVQSYLELWGRGEIVREGEREREYVWASV